MHNRSTRLYVDLVNVPAPTAAATYPVCPLSTNIGCEFGPEPDTPSSHRCVADLDQVFEQQVVDIAKAQRKPHPDKHRKTGDLRWAVDVPERAGQCSGVANSLICRSTVVAANEYIYFDSAP